MPDAEGKIRPVSIPNVPWHETEEFKRGVKKAAKLLREGDIEGLVAHANRNIVPASEQCCGNQCSRCRRTTKAPKKEASALSQQAERLAG